MEEAYANTLNEVAEFVNGIDFESYVRLPMIPCAMVMSVDGRYQDKIPTGFIVAGPSIAAHHEVFDAIARRIASEDAGTVLIVNAAQATNLKALLKHINQHGTLQRIDGREDGLSEDVHQASSGS